MTVKRLKQYRSLKREIKQLGEQYRDLVNRKERITSDSVNGSMLEYPYIRQVVKIQGLDVIDQERANRIKRRVCERQAEAEREVEEIDKWVASIGDSQMRQIIHLRFIRGMKWVQVARAMGGNNSEDSVRKAFERFMEKK